MSFIEWKLFHDNRSNLTVYEKPPIDFIALSPDFIYRMGALPRKEKEFDSFEKL
jgi:hypothetical protein